MNPEFKGLQDVTFSVNGTVIGRGHIQEVVGTLAVDQIYEIGSSEPKPLGGYSGTVELKDCEFHPEFFALTGIPCDVTISKLVPKKPRSKKKRIRKKFAKKYTMSQVAYHDCIITNFGEDK